MTDHLQKQGDIDDHCKDQETDHRPATPILGNLIRHRICEKREVGRDGHNHSFVE